MERSQQVERVPVTSILDERFGNEMGSARHIWKLYRKAYMDAVRNTTCRMVITPDGGLVGHEPREVVVARQKAEEVGALWTKALVLLATDDDMAVQYAYRIFREICRLEWPMLEEAR